MYDYRARFYDPLVGSFISPDSIVPDFAKPQSFNRYSYVLNNPVRYTDPSGHCGPLTPLCVVAVLGGALLLSSASEPLPPGEAPSTEQGLLGLGLLTLPIAPYAYGAAEPYIYLYGDKIFRASQTPGGQIAGNAAEEAIDACLDNCSPENVVASAILGGAIPASQVLHVSKLNLLPKAAPGTDTIVLGHFTIPRTYPDNFLDDTWRRVLDPAADQLGGRTLYSLPGNMEVIGPQLEAADRIIFFTSPGMRGLTMEEMQFIQARPELRDKTIFIYGGMDNPFGP